MNTPTLTEVVAYADQVARTGRYSRAEMETILVARFLRSQDWLETLTAQGPAGLSSLRNRAKLIDRLHTLLRRLGSLACSLFVWLLGGQFDETHRVIRDVLSNLYGD